MDKHSIKTNFLISLILSGLFFNGLLVPVKEANAKEIGQIAQSVADEEDDEDDEDC